MLLLLPPLLERRESAQHDEQHIFRANEALLVLFVTLRGCAVFSPIGTTDRHFWLSSAVLKRNGQAEDCTETMTTYSTDSQGKFIPATQRPDGTWRKPRRVRDGYVPQEEVPLYESKGKQFAQKPALPPGLSPEVVQKAKEKRERDRLRQQLREEQQKKEQQNKKLQTGVIAVDGGGGGVVCVNGEKPKGAKTANPAPQRSKKTPELPDILLDQRPKPSQAAPKAKAPKTAPQPKAASTATPSKHDTVVDELAGALATGAQLNSQPAPNPPTAAAEETPQDAAQLEVAKKLRKLRKKIREIEAIETKLRSSDGPKLDKDQLEKVKRKPDILQEIEELEVQYSAGAM
uniref:Partner of Y14 and mago n=1 Tax=Anopheles dirus TaxID=7168 RepID=A0A182NIP4_9DIPT